MYTIHKCESLDTELFIFELPQRVNKKYVSTVNYNNKTPFIQLSRVITPSGIYEQDGKYKIDILLNLQEYYEFFMNLEMSCINFVHKNYSEWFGNTSENDNLESSFISFLKLKNKDSILTLPIEYNGTNEEFECEVYDENKERIPYTDINKNTCISLIICFNGIQFSKNKFATYWSISQIKINKSIASQNIVIQKLPLNQYHFLSDNEKEDEEDSDQSCVSDNPNEHTEILENLVQQYKTRELYNKI